MTTRHLHIWTAPDEHGTWICLTCAELSPTCIVEKPSDEPGEGHPTDTSLPICEGCLNYERTLLDDVVAAAGRIDYDPPTPVRSYAYDASTAHSSDDEGRVPFGLDQGVDDWYHHARGARSESGVWAVLTDWSDAWGEASGNGRTHADSPAEHIKALLIWASSNPDASAWDDYRREMRDLLATARSLDPHRPERTGETCLDCGGRLVREWRRRTGLGDDVVCETCRRVYDHVSYRLARSQRARKAALFDADTLVTMDEARAALPDARPGTLRVWKHRARRDHAEGTSTAPVAMRGKDRRTGEPLFRLGDLRDALGVALLAIEDRVS